MENLQILKAHIKEVEELIENLLVNSRLGNRSDQNLVANLHRDAMDKRILIREFYR